MSLYTCRKDYSRIIELSEGKGSRATERTHGVSRITQKRWVIKAATHLNEINTYITAHMELTRLQVDEFWAFILKKENRTSDESIGNSQEMGDRWTFVGVIPDSSFIHTIHTGQRTQEEAQVFSDKIKQNSNGKAPYIESDGWFYEKVLTQTYSTTQEVPYSGRGRKPLPKRVIDPSLKYAQVVKERKNGKIKNISTRIVLGDELEILDILPIFIILPKKMRLLENS